MEKATQGHVSIESPNTTDESKLVLGRMVLGDRRSQHINTDKDWRNKKMTKTDHQPTTKKKKSSIDCSMVEEQEEEEEGQFSSSEQILLKNLSEAISSEHRRHRRAKRNSHDGGALEMASQLNTNLSSEEPTIPNKRPRYQRRNSFVIRSSPPRSLPLNRSAPDLCSPTKPERMPPDTKTWGNLSWSNTNDTTCYKFASMSFEDAKPLIPEPPSKRSVTSCSQRNINGSTTTRSPDTHWSRAFVFSSLAISGLETENPILDTLDETEEESMRVPRFLLPRRRSTERRFPGN
jgi:hypothetical protein